MLSGATAPEQVPELQLFANLAIEEGAPPLSYWEGLCDQLKKVGCELDFPAIEERVFNCLVLGPKAMNQAEDGHLLSFAPPPLLFIGPALGTLAGSFLPNGLPKALTEEEALTRGHSPSLS
jgi:hypothetical protein